MIKHRKMGILLAGLLLMGMAGNGMAKEPCKAMAAKGHAVQPISHRQAVFQRISTLANYRNNASIADETVSEIVAATQDGMRLVYTDAAMEQIGFVDISDPSAPIGTGKLDVGGEPTSVDILGNAYALVAVNTSASYTNPSGKLVVVDLNTRDIKAQIDLGGQPDSIKVSPDGRYAAIAIENERDEDVTVDGVEGGLPQLPAGYLAIVDIAAKDPTQWARRDVDLTGLADYAGSDPEPEFVDVNDRNEAAVTLQENNHLVIVDLEKGTVVNHFSMGTVTLTDIDTVEDGLIQLKDTLENVPREPDAVAWVRHGRSDNPFIATANEGDLFGGSRGFSIFQRNGGLLYDSGSELEKIAVQAGHYPEDRSENKGTEPEAIEYARLDGTDYLFVGSERGSFIAVYELSGAKPHFKQLLPAPLAPEGLLAIPSRNLLVAAGESDDPSYGVRSTLMIYALSGDRPTYPQILSAAPDGMPIPWSALSGMVAVPGQPDTLLAVWDSFFSESQILTIDVSTRPARITSTLTLTGGNGNYDPEGIAIAPDGTYWIASEGNAGDSRPNRLLQVDAAGKVINEVDLPDNIIACRAASENRGTLGSGFEGVTVLPQENGYKLLVAQQRGWDYTTDTCEDLDDDAGGLNAKGEPKQTRIWIYDPQAKSWDHVAWELADLPENASWVGLSEISRTPSGDVVLIERDNRSGDFAALKTLVKIDWDASSADGLIESAEKRVFDLKPALLKTNGWISDKPEGVAITDSGRTFLVTDNDGVDDWSGETWFLRLGDVDRLFE